MYFRLLCLILLVTPSLAVGSRDPSALCDDAARLAAADSGVPVEFLLAITRVETGRGSGDDLRPWPWTTNQGGDGAWHDTASEATEAARSAVDQGVSNIDIGCFQLNYRWHADGFASLVAMLDPNANAEYAARFLSRLYAETGDWPQAVAAYHSRSDEHAERYMAKFERVLAGLPVQPTPEPALQRANTYPLLQAGTGQRGSLVPLNSARTPLIGALP
ncbi:MAG: transglycosylase SLT domain-containing protein [Paracoccaceae bacterium]